MVLSNEDLLFMAEHAINVVKFMVGSNSPQKGSIYMSKQFCSFELKSAPKALKAYQKGDDRRCWWYLFSNLVRQDIRSRNEHGHGIF